MPISLSDSELSIIMDACQPLAPPERSAFLVAVSIELERERQIGPGVVSRVCRSPQRQFRDVPNFNGGPSKYDG